MLRLHENFTYLLWRNRYSLVPVVVGTVSFGDAFDWTTADLSPAQRSALKETFAGVVAETAPVGVAELVARIAQHIQDLGDVTAPSCGVASRNEAERRADLFFSCRDMYLAPRSLLRAVQITDALIQSEFSAARLDKMLQSCTDMVEAHGVGRAVLDMVKVAERRGIPWRRPNGLARHVHLGQGSRQQSFGALTSGDRLQTFNVLAKIRLPVGRFTPVKSFESARVWAKKIGYPLALRPIERTTGQPVSITVRNDDELQRALADPHMQERPSLLQSHFAGSDHRLLVVDGKVAVATRGGSGGTALDVVHPDNARAAVRAAKATGLTVAEIDFVSPDIAKSWRDVGGGIVDVGAPAGSPVADVRGQAIDDVYPDGDDGRIPTAMITGTKGKTTTTGMLASILSFAGHAVGYATTEGVTIDGERVATGDLAGWDGAEIVMRDPTVTAAVLETARGGLIESGMYLDRCDVAALLNVQREQIDMDGVRTLDDMVAMKRKVLDAARKAVVLNADDTRCLALGREFAGSVRTFLFSRNSDSSAVREHLGRGGDALFLDKREGHETIVVASGANATALLRTADVPATANGIFWQHASAAMAAAALAVGLGVEMDAIRGGLKRYGQEFPGAACRLVFPDGFPMRILFDRTTSGPAYAAAVSVTDQIPVAGKRICALTLVGNRPDWAFGESAAALAGHFQRYVCFEREDYLRGRKPGEISQRLADALIAAGVAPGAVSIAHTYIDAAKMIAGEAADDDFVVVFGTDKAALVEQYRTAFREARRLT